MKTAVRGLTRHHRQASTVYLYHGIVLGYWLRSGGRLAWTPSGVYTGHRWRSDFERYLVALVRQLDDVARLLEGA